jgi:AmmeMemoRadiSam system protein B
MESTPKLRTVEAFPVQNEGEELICLRDPEGFAEGPIFLNKYLAILVSRMNGQNTLRDIQADFMRATGELLAMEQLEGLVRQLDDQGYLESERFKEFYRSLVQKFLNSPTRGAEHAGSAYDGDPNALLLQIDSFFTHPEGPGPVAAPNPGDPLRGLIAPHIDFHRGGPTYAHAYRSLAEHPGADRFILFGTCHNPMQRRFALTSKNFETPLGTVETDHEFVRRLAAGIPQDYFADEFAHRAEHSLEFQAVFLKHTLRAPGSFKIVPILVGSFQDIYEDGRAASQDGEIDAFVKAVRSTMAEMPARYTVLAGADLAHVGRRFGDPSGPSPEAMESVAREDRRFLELVASGDAEGMFRSIAAERDRRRVCGYPPIYMTLRCLDGPRGQLLQYRQWTDFESGAAVTFAAMAIF